MHLQFISVLHTDITQVVEILPRVRQEITYILSGFYTKGRPLVKSNLR